MLRLLPLDPIDTPPGARDRGNLIHNAIGDFTKAYAAQLPPDPAAVLIRLGRERFAPLADYPEAQAFWWPRFLRIARWFTDWDAARRAAAGAPLAEIRGEIEIALDTGPFRLAGTADRIERRHDGSYAIIDYTTGNRLTATWIRRTVDYSLAHSTRAAFAPRRFWCRAISTRIESKRSSHLARRSMHSVWGRP